MHTRLFIAILALLLCPIAVRADKHGGQSDRVTLRRGFAVRWDRSDAHAAQGVVYTIFPRGRIPYRVYGVFDIVIQCRSKLLAFCLLADGRHAWAAPASAARKADVVAVSASGQLEFPGAVRAWFDIWLWLLEDENPALVALFDSSTTPTVGSVHPYLSRIAQRAKIEFFSAYRQVSLFPVIRPKGEAIWPKPVERALLSWLESRGRAKRSVVSWRKCCQLA
jgi:hypothetical protein